jgi:hypothetical protein
MLFRKYKLVFVHVPKSAGASIEELFGFPNQVASTKERHDTLAEIQQKYPECIGWPSFLVARNIWHKIVSIYNHVKVTPVPGWPRHKVKTFTEFVRFLCSTKQHYEEASISRMAKGLGQSKVTHILRYENLHKDLEEFLDSQGITDIDVKKLPYFRHRLPEYNRDYKSYYNEETRKLIEERFKDDIEQFGYRFEDL